MFVMRFLKPSQNSVTVQQRFLMTTYRNWRSLLSTCTTDPVQRRVLTRQGWISLHASRDPMMQSHQPVQLSKNMQNVLPTRLGSSGLRHPSPIQTSAVLPSGGGLRMESHGRYVGQHFLQLQRAVRS